MTKLEKTVEALRRCVPVAEFARALAEVEATEPETPRDPETLIRALLFELGTPENIKGHPYLVTALLLVVEDPGRLDAVVKELYPAIAGQHGTTSSRAERAIRHAIDVTWVRGDPDILNSYFGWTVNAAKGRPTNSEFLARVGNIIRQKLREV
jgi:two-component system response regulator (stage 0 sporulation protein A)